MPTTKKLGCGGRYSAYAFRPCSICQSKNNPSACLGIQTKVGKRHLEWYTDFVGRARWEESRDMQHECNEICEDEDTPENCDCESCCRAEKMRLRGMNHG